jgi:putative ABC transport system permease protein
VEKIMLDIMYDLPDFSKLKVKCASTNEVEGVRAAVVEKGLIASSISDIVDQANKVFSVVQIVLMMFGVIALVVSAIGMFNTMTITLLERTEEIGIMKAIGASNTAIWLMFISEATMMGFLGGFGGVIIGYLEGEAINLIINLIATRFGGERVDLFYSPLWFVSTIIIFGAFVGFLTGIFPARKASKIDALDALRYK